MRIFAQDKQKCANAEDTRSSGPFLRAIEVMASKPDGVVGLNYQFRKPADRRKHSRAFARSPRSRYATPIFCQMTAWWMYSGQTGKLSSQEYLASPEQILGGFGLTPPAPDADTRAWLRLKEIRDIASRLTVLTLMLTTDSRTVGIVLLVLAIIPFGDMSNVL